MTMGGAFIVTYVTRYSEIQADAIGLMDQGFVVLTHGPSHFWIVTWKRRYYGIIDFLVKVNFESWLFGLIFGIFILYLSYGY